MLTSFPVYLLLDISSSMTGAPLAALNNAISEIFQYAQSDPLLDDTVMLCVISFSNDARVEVPLAHPTEVRAPELQAGGTTNYAPALRLLRSTIASDVAALKEKG